jgi:Rrf2 family protein
MRIALGRRGDYSVRAVLDLARHYGSGRRKTREIASAMGIPELYLPQLLASLVRTGVLTAVAGPDGGYTLSRHPQTITLLEVVESAEGPLRTGRCLLRDGPCDWDEVCPVHRSWSGAQDALVGELEDTTLWHLAREDEAIEQHRYQGDPSPTSHRQRRRGVCDRPDGASGGAPGAR